MPSQEDVMLAVLWSLGAEPAKDARQRPRVLADDEQAWLFEDDGFARRAVPIHDVSASGVCLLRDVPMPEGTACLLELPRPAGTARVVCRVAHCRPDGTRFRIGVSFVRFLESADENELQSATANQTNSTDQLQALVDFLRRAGQMENTMVQRDLLPTSVQQWLTAGESLYATLIEDFQTAEAKLAELEAALRQKVTEVNRVAQVLGKPAVQNSRLSAELVNHYVPEIPNDPLRGAKYSPPRPSRA